jgi:hypothetical protein
VKPILAPVEYDASQMVDGEYIRASLGYDGFAFLEGSFRSPFFYTKENNRFDYFSVSGSLVFLTN